MSVKLLQNDEIKREIYNRLVDNWVIFAGDSRGFSIVENAAYKPGTPANKGFELLGAGRNFIAFGKKTKELKELLGNPDDFEDIMSIEFVLVDKNKGIATQITGANGDKEDCALKMASAVSEQLSKSF